MDARRVKFFALGIGIIGCMVFLVLVGMDQPGGYSYYVTVGEFLAASETETKGFRVNGKVEPGSIERNESGMDVRFVMTDGSASLAVEYHGIISDQLVDDADVVVEGRLDGPTFVAHTLLAKCPSKYESADGAESLVET